LSLDSKEVKFFCDKVFIFQSSGSTKLKILLINAIFLAKPDLTKLHLRVIKQTQQHYILRNYLISPNNPAGQKIVYQYPAASSTTRLLA